MPLALCLWRAPALSHLRWASFATTLWIPLGFILLFAPVLCISYSHAMFLLLLRLLCTYGCMVNPFLLSVDPDPYMHWWTFASVFWRTLSSAGDLAPTALVGCLLSVCSLLSFFLDASQLLMNGCFFLAARKKGLLHICWDWGFLWEVVKSAQWFLNIGRPDQIGGGGNGIRRRNIPLFWSDPGEYSVFYLWEVKLSSNSAFFPQHFWRVKTRSEKRLSYSPFLPPPSFIKGLVLTIGHFCVLVDWREIHT